MKTGAFGELVWLAGCAALEVAEQLDSLVDVTLAKYADPMDDAREEMTLEEAREIAAQDPSLIYLPMQWDWYGIWAAILDGGSYATRRERVVNSHGQTDVEAVKTLGPLILEARLDDDDFDGACNAFRRGYTRSHIG